MKPDIFGYLQADENTPDADLAQMERILFDFAETHGFVLNGIFTDDQSGQRPAFNDMMDEMRQNNARHIVMFNLSHLSEQAELRAQMIHKLEHDLDAVLLVVGDKSWLEIQL